MATTDIMAEDKELDSLVDAFAVAGPSTGKKREVTYADFEKMLNETPLFMSASPDGLGMEDNEVLQGLRSLVFDGEGDEIALNFKDHGNELYLQKSYKEAVKSYTEGLDAAPVDFDLRISLLNNRAASNLFLKNHASVLKDAGVVIALCTKEKKPVPIKALFRAGKALIALERWKEARDVVERGKEMASEKDKKDWEALGKDVENGWRRVVERAERIRREKQGKFALQAAIEARGLIVVNTPSPPDNPHPAAFDPSALPTLQLSDTTWTPPPLDTPLIFPTFLMYPTHAQSDFITHFHQETSLDDQLAQMFPSSPSSPQMPFPNWDTKREYYTSNLVVYVETRHRRLLKVGKDLTLREVLAKGFRAPVNGVGKDGVVLRDGLLSFVVLPKGQEEKKFIDEFKRKRDAK